MNILIVDDDKKICSMLEIFFSKYNYNIKVAHSGEEALEILSTNHNNFDVVTLDIHMQGICGIETCKKIREFSDVPILMVTSSQEDINTIVALEVGADDYVIKPFNPMVLYSRIKNVIRRSHKQDQISVNKKTANYVFCDCILDVNTQTLKHNGEMIPITTGVYRVLKYFLENSNIVLSRELLMEQTQNRSLENFDRSIDIQISRLRKILKDAGINNAIKTIHGSGYMWTQEVTFKNSL
ncbi:MULTISPECIES: response regulator transcription factor [unclassified Francisella]|uniref:response regulator transcription factor n=1 Tax=unclassified Francisella TaxID=2610885 RepID=UPI002E34728D|nr:MULTISPECIES: response regulator transcription factor [unclassified Francisella]MED7818904.1 response regulator transcription factor [Francisella sp. 19S2-4]MED7829741.1 response regulator transcription factor [Francisella sp. 19S2-10]